MLQDQLTLCKSISGLSSIPVSIRPLLHQYHSFVISLAIRLCEGFSFAVLSQDCFGSSIFFALRVSSTMSLSIFSGLLIEIRLNLKISLGSFYSVTKLSLLIYKHGIFLHLLRSVISPHFICKCILCLYEI